MSMRIDTHFPAEDVAVLTITGELDVYTSPRLKEEVAQTLDQGARKLIINLDPVEHLDSTGLGVLMATMRRAVERGGNLLLVCNNQRTRRIFEITGLQTLFQLHASEPEALAQVQAA